MSTFTKPTTTTVIDDIGYGRQFDSWYHRLFPDDASVVAEVERLDSLHPDPAWGTVEFGVGNGRIALPLSRRVGPITGIDSSPEMLGVLRRDLTDDTPVEAVHADIRTYTADHTVGLVYCVCATLSMLLTPEEQQQAVQRAADLLAPGGRLVIETHNKAAVVALHEGRSRATYFTPYPEPGTGLQSHSVLLPEGSLWHLSHVWYESDGTTRVGTEVSRLTTPEEMDAYARAAGLEPETRLGDWPADAEPTARTHRWRSAPTSGRRRPGPERRALRDCERPLSVVCCMIGASVLLPGGGVMPITNEQAAGHAFLRPLYTDPYYPDHVVDRGRAILLRLCERIEAEQPADLAALYVLTQAATEEFNLLEAAFDAAGSEIETVAREAIGEDFWFVASAYGFADADGEELIATRDW